MQKHWRFFMCRYAFKGPYKSHYACFECRKSFRQIHPKDLPVSKKKYVTTDAWGKPVYEDIPTDAICPDCAGPLSQIGMDFKPPKISNVRQWKKVQILYENGIRFQGCGCDGGGKKPAKLSEIDIYFEQCNKVDEEFERGNQGIRLLKKYAKRSEKRGSKKPAIKPAVKFFKP